MRAKLLPAQHDAIHQVVPLEVAYVADLAKRCTRSVFDRVRTHPFCVTEAGFMHVFNERWKTQNVRVPVREGVLLELLADF